MEKCLAHSFGEGGRVVVAGLSKNSTKVHLFYYLVDKIVSYQISVVVKVLIKPEEDCFMYVSWNWVTIKYLVSVG